jgi:hypothetical protein
LFQSFFYLFAFVVENGFNKLVQALLPNFPKDDPSEKARTLEMLFGGENFRFGNPLEQFRHDLLAGFYMPEKHEMLELVGRAKRRDRDLLVGERHLRVLQQILAGRKRLLEATAKTQITLPVSVQKMDTKKFQVINVITV